MTKDRRLKLMKRASESKIARVLRLRKLFAIEGVAKSRCDQKARKVRDPHLDG